jgi:hypothetical protein|nr:MAG TPA: protein of unknown function DUF1424 [Caudoviricetes sp.]
MPWIKKEYDCGNMKFVERKYASRYGAKKEVAHIIKKEAENKTTEIQQWVNDRNAMKRFAILANANFKEDDYFITYTFRRGTIPPSVRECKKLWAKFRRKMRKVYKKAGIDFKYLYVFEHEGVRPHFHMLFNNDGINIKDMPKWEYGTPKIIPLDNREYHTIGEYFVKCVYDMEKGEYRPKGEIGSSRGNLFRPEPTITVLEGPDWNDIPEEEEGYEIDYDSLENGYIEVVENRLSFRYQSYRLMKQKIIA